MMTPVVSKHVERSWTFFWMCHSFVVRLMFRAVMFRAVMFRSVVLRAVGDVSGGG